MLQLKWDKTENTIFIMYKNGKHTRYLKEFQDDEHRASVTHATAKLFIGCTV